MGADYYVFQYLEINHSYGTSYIELFCNRGYYCNCLDPGYDSDTDNPRAYEEKIEKIKKIHLIPNFQPILIYNNGQYVNPRFQEKYNELIEYYISEGTSYWKNTGAVLEYKEDIMNIYKIEVRNPMS